MSYLFAQSNDPGFFSEAPQGVVFLFVAVFVIVIGGILFQVVKGASRWMDNNQQPILNETVTVVTKRTAVSSTGNTNSGDFTSTTYYATFEFLHGSRKEFVVSAHAYGLLAEGDTGQLTFQGTRYKGFERIQRTAASDMAKQTPADNKEGFCPFCGAAVVGDFKFCPKCGKTLPELVSESL